MMRFAEKERFSRVRALWETCFPDEAASTTTSSRTPYKEKWTLLH